VRSRTQIPRQDATLALLPSLALFPEEETGHQAEQGPPVAWAFLGADGSLCSLHTEPEWRGRGIAKVLARKLFREGGFAGGLHGEGTELNKEGKIGERTEQQDMEVDGGRWAHADVAVDNMSSRKVMKGLGGEEAWTVVWIRVDMEKVKQMVQGDL